MSLLQTENVDFDTEDEATKERRTRLGDKMNELDDDIRNHYGLMHIVMTSVKDIEITEFGSGLTLTQLERLEGRVTTAVEQQH